VIVSRYISRPASLRHVTKNPSPQLLYFPHLQNRDAHNSFIIRSYADWRVSPAFSSQPVDVSHSPKSLPHNLFADPHPLNLYATIFYKMVGREGSFQRSDLRTFGRASYISPLNATLMQLPASVANKRLTARLSSLDATLTKKPGALPGAGGAVRLL
jgi:hypothetical protein